MSDLRCETCVWWTREPALATGTRRAAGADLDLGACHLNPPSIVATVGIGMSLFPEVHALRFCSMWVGPEDDGAREGIPDGNVVAFPAEKAA